MRVQFFRDFQESGHQLAHGVASTQAIPSTSTKRKRKSDTISRTIRRVALAIRRTALAEKMRRSRIWILIAYEHQRPSTSPPTLRYMYWLLRKGYQVRVIIL